MSTTSIDDVLATAHLPPDQRAMTPSAPEEKFSDDFGNDIQKSNDEISQKSENKPAFQQKLEENDVESEKKPELDSETHDEYGNEKPSQEKKYSEDEVNERINKAVRERLERLERNNPAAQQPTQQQQKQAADAGFQFNQQSEKTWDQQLKDFIRQTNEELHRETIINQQNQREQQINVEFEEKFKQGMGKFKDFVDVVSVQPITDAMTLATRGMKDPAAFIYAASRRHGTELERISKIPDAYAQMLEMGRLEERMRKAQSSTKTPKPISPHREDVHTKEPKHKSVTIEDMIRDAEQLKLSRMKRRR